MIRTAHRSSSRRLAVAAARTACLEGMGKSLTLGAGCIRVYPACTYRISRVYEPCLENILRALFRPDASRGRRRRARRTTLLVRRRTRSVVVHRSRDDRENTTNARVRPHDREREVTTRNVTIDRAIDRIEYNRSFASVDDARTAERGQRGREFVEEDECRRVMTSRTRSGRRKR